MICSRDILIEKSPVAPEHQWPGSRAGYSRPRRRRWWGGRRSSASTSSALHQQAVRHECRVLPASRLPDRARRRRSRAASSPTSRRPIGPWSESRARIQHPRHQGTKKEHQDDLTRESAHFFLLVPWCGSTSSRKARRFKRAPRAVTGAIADEAGYGGLCVELLRMRARRMVRSRSGACRRGWRSSPAISTIADAAVLGRGGATEDWDEPACVACAAATAGCRRFRDRDILGDEPR